MTDQEPLAYLTTRARQGDAAARATLSDTLQPYLDRIVRRVLRRGRAGTELEAKVARLARERSPEVARAELVDHLCRGVVVRMCGEPTAATVADTGHLESPQRAATTVALHVS